MPRDRSLDEFLSEEAPPNEDAGSSPAGEDPQVDSGVDPIASTYAFSADEAACAACGAVVAERWRGEEGMVCSDCKEW